MQGDYERARHGLREAAQERLAGAPAEADSSQSAEELLHELRVHQIELEMQNEALRQSQIDLEESRDRYRDLFDFAPVSYLVVGVDDVIAEVNHAGAALMATKRERLLGQRFTSLVVESQRRQWLEYFHAMLAHSTARPHEIALEREDGSRFVGRLHGVRISGKDGAQYVRLAILDIFEEKLATQTLLDAARAKDEFLAMLAHELRNPLAAIRSAAAILGQVAAHDDRIPWTQDIIERQVTHLARLLDDLLDVSRVGRGAVTIRTQKVGMKSIIDQAIETVRPLIETKGHQLDVTLTQDALIVDVDAVRMTQVLINLLDNAVKYTPNGGKIGIEAAHIGDRVHVTVRDNGIGISAALLPKIFDLFQQGERGLDRRQGGLGIGLTLARQLAVLQGGQLTAKSGGVGAGAEFLLTLPAAQQTIEVTMNASKAPTTADILRILMVDDDALVLATGSVLLSHGGHEVKTASSATAALEIMANYRPDLILLDIGLPGMDGYEAARELRRVQLENHPFYLVALSGYGDDNARKRSAETGFDDHFVKPVDFHSLLAQVSRRLASRQAN